MTGTPLLRTHGLTKRFGEFAACDDVSVSLGQGQIVALLGENGAGKSTFVKMLFGSLRPTAGLIEWRGERVEITDPSVARRLGIGMVHQHFSLFEPFTCAENIALGLGTGEPLARLSERAREAAERYGLPFEADAVIADLAIGERQRVEIVRCLLQDPSLVILDEPTSVLTPQETVGLFDALRALRDEGRTILYISHKLEEVRALCDHAIVLRAGRVVRECDPRQETAASLASAMIGGDVAPLLREAGSEVVHDVALAVNGLNRTSETPFGTDLHDVSFSARGGEIVGVAGIAGNGQSELFGCLSGEVLSAPDTVRMFGQPVGALGIAERRALGAAFVPEERLGHGAAPAMRLDGNYLLSRHSRSDGTRSAFGWLSWARARALVAKTIDRMDVRTTGRNPVAGRLSGGNLQKFIVGRELAGDPMVLVVDQPTWGVDAGAAARIRQALLTLARQGACIVVISQDLDELFEVADRLAVINAGRLGAFRPVAQTTREMIGLEMGAGHGYARAA